MTFGIFKENSRLRKMKYLVTLKFYQIVNKQIYKNVAAKLASKTRKSSLQRQKSINYGRLS